MNDIQRFVDGFCDFKYKYFGDLGLYEKLKNGQSPKTLLIGCSDSRVIPELLTACDPGDLFVVRNVANLVPPFEPDCGKSVGAALEYAVCHLDVMQIIILGHSNCGGISALVKGYTKKTELDFIGDWIKIAGPIRNKIISNYPNSSIEEKIKMCELSSIAFSLKNLITYPFIAEKVSEGKLSLIGWYFDIQKERLCELDPRTNQFRPLMEKVAVVSE